MGCRSFRHGKEGGVARQNLASLIRRPGSPIPNSRKSKEEQTFFLSFSASSSFSCMIGTLKFADCRRQQNEVRGLS
ncbi:unnamed protein product [Amoebophrya sp. A120]|nr:unnamed protein product [Amoebophrya sp. A120]|eukprot:GSA120T00013873001.1